jgi:hypothetical protein
MTITLDRVLEDALCLTGDTRLALVERLLESVPEDPSVFEAQMAVAVGRAEELESGTVQGIPGDEGLRRVRESIFRRSES